MKDLTEMEQKDEGKWLPILVIGGALLCLWTRREELPTGKRIGAELMGPPMLTLGQREVNAGTSQALTILIRNASTRRGVPVPATLTGKFLIYEGSGAKLREVEIPATDFPADDVNYMLSESFTTVVGTVAERNVGFILYHNSTEILRDEWANVYTVRAPTKWGAKVVIRPVLAQWNTRSSV